MDPTLSTLGWRSGPIVVLQAPSEFSPTVTAWTAAGVAVATSLTAKSPLVVSFSPNRSGLEAAATSLVANLSPGGTLWVAHPGPASPLQPCDLCVAGSMTALTSRGLTAGTTAVLHPHWVGVRMHAPAVVTATGRVDPNPLRGISRPGT